MWIERKDKREEFLHTLHELKSQVIVVRGARQVGKTSFIVRMLESRKECQNIKLNLAYTGKITLEGREYYGRDFFGKEPSGEELIRNLELTLGKPEAKENSTLLFIDEADQYPLSLEAIQTCAEYSPKLKVIITGSNLENIKVCNVATGRRRYFDLYPLSFYEFLNAYNQQRLYTYVCSLSLKDKKFSTAFHNELMNIYDLYLKLGGMPKLITSFIDESIDNQNIPQIISDLASSIEENVKSILDEKVKLYEYDDVLRKIALLSSNTLKFSKLQVRHATRSEAKQLVIKTVGARVAHKIRLFESGSDLSKYIIFDSGILNYFLNGSDLLNQKISEHYLGMMYETAVGLEIIRKLYSRDDLFYWKSNRGAEVEYFLRSPYQIGIDVKSTRGDTKSLDSLANFEKDVSYIVKVNKEEPSLNLNHKAKVPFLHLERKISLLTIPHYLSARLFELLNEF